MSLPTTMHFARNKFGIFYSYSWLNLNFRKIVDLVDGMRCVYHRCNRDFHWCYKNVQFDWIILSGLTYQVANCNYLIPN